MAEAETVGPAQVFGDPGEHHVCCDCCAGYCSASETGVVTLDLWCVTIDGTVYVTDRYAAVRADLIEVDVRDRRFTWTNVSSSWTGWTAPEVEPGPSQQPLRPDIVERLLDCGIDIREGGEAEKQHLYVDGEHIGWVMSAAEGIEKITLDEVPRIRAYVAESDRLGHILVSGDEHPWTSAAIILHEFDRLTAGGGPRG